MENINYENYGLDEEMSVENGINEGTEAQGGNVVALEQSRKKLPYHSWYVHGTEYKLVLKASVTCALENKLRKSMLDLITEGNIPKLGVMLTIIQGALKKYHHGMSFERVQDIYDQYQDEGGSLTSLFTDVILPLYRVSGFLSEKQSERTEEIASELR